MRNCFLMFIKNTNINLFYSRFILIFAAEIKNKRIMKQLNIISAIFAALLMTACDKQDSYIESEEFEQTQSSIMFQTGYYEVESNYSIAPGVNDREMFVLLNTEEEFNRVYPDYNKKVGIVGEFYVNTNSTAVFRIVMFEIKPGKLSLTGYIINDKRFKDIYYTMSFDVDEFRSNEYKLTFKGTESPVFANGDSFVIRLLGRNYYEAYQNYFENH